VTLVQRRGAAIVLRADQWPVKADHGQRVAHPRHHRHVLLARLAHLARLQVDDMHTGSISRKIGTVPIQQQVKALLAAAQDKGTRRCGHCLSYQIGRDAHDLCLHIHLGAMVGKDLQSFAG
jgi:hypothetical protein